MQGGCGPEQAPPLSLLCASRSAFQTNTRLTLPLAQILPDMSPIAISDSTIRTTATIADLKKMNAAPKAWAPVSMSSVVKTIGNRKSQPHARRGPRADSFLFLAAIREVLAGVDLSAAASGDKPLLNLALGDPSVYGNLPPPVEALDAIEKSLRSGKSDGYPQSVGYPIAREAVAKYFDEGEGGWRIKPEDVVMTHGASGALDMVRCSCGDRGSVES